MLSAQSNREKDVSFYSLFTPLTSKKAIFIIASLGIIIYFNMLFSGFVWDDKTFISGNQVFFKSGIINLFLRNPFNNLGYYRGIQALYFSIIFNLFGTMSFFYHLPQLMLHISNCILIFILFRSFFGKKLALFLSLIFIVHPMQVESVSYISGTGEPMFFLFGLSALLLQKTKLSNKTKYFLTTIFITLGLLTKETGIIFPIILTVYIFIFKNGKKILPYIFINIMSICIYAFMRFFVAGIYFFNINFLPMSKLTFIGRLQNVPAVFFYYLKTFFYPAKLSIDQLWVVDKISLSSFYFPLFIDLLFFALIILFGINLYKNNKKILPVFIFFLLWFLIGMSLYLQIFPLDQTVSDRWFYFPLAGLLGLIGVVFKILSEKNVIQNKLIYSFFVIVVILLSIRTIVRNSDWVNPIKLYTHDTKISDNYNLESNFASELFLTGQYNDSIFHYKKSSAMFPYDRTFNNIAYIYELQKNIKMAKEYYLKSLTAYDPIPPYNHKIDIYLNISRFLYYYDDPTTAHKYIALGLKNYPQNFTLLVLLGLSDRKLNNEGKAQTEFKKAYGLADSQNAKEIILQIIENPKTQVPINMFY